MAALKKANEARLERFRFRQEIKNGDLKISDAVDDPRAQRMTVLQLLSCKKWLQAFRIQMLLQDLREDRFGLHGAELGKIEVMESEIVGELQESQKRALVKELWRWENFSVGSGNRLYPRKPR